MWEPVGPLPASVYWRRRGLAVAATLVLTSLVAWSVTAAAQPPDQAPAVRTSRTALSSPQQSAPLRVSPSPAPASPVSGTGTAGASPSATPTAVTGPSSDQPRPAETPGPSVPAAVPVPVPSTGPVPCTRAMLSVTSGIDRPQHRVGDRPVLRLVITNTGGAPCVRDLDPARQEIVVWTGNQSAKLWSSNDCSNVGGPDLRTLVPGQPVAFAVAWAGRTSTPGCAQPRTVVPAGSYRVLTRLDNIISPPTPFILSP